MQEKQQISALFGLVEAITESIAFLPEMTEQAVHRIFNNGYINCLLSRHQKSHQAYRSNDRLQAPDLLLRNTGKFGSLILLWNLRGFLLASVS